MKPEYRNGGEGFCMWADENVRVQIYPPGSTVPAWVQIGDLPNDPYPGTGRSYRQFWEHQKEVFCEALRMENGEFVYRLIVFCWQRGEGKSVGAVLIQLWKFFCFPRQLIVCGANSKDQIKFVHYDEMTKTILNSPKLLSEIGIDSVKEKAIEFRDSRGVLQSSIRPISTSTGILSNITGYTFSEIFDMKNPKYFTQLDGSMRNTPNALGILDSTVSSKDHILYRLFDTWTKRDDPTLFFSYRFSKDADYRDYWHPRNTQQQLDSYKAKWLPADFDRYFRNLWSAGGSKLFTSEMVEATQYLGIDHDQTSHTQMMELLLKRNKLKEGIEISMGPGKAESMGVTTTASIQEIESRLWHVSDYYALQENGIPAAAPIDSLGRLTDLFNTHWAIIAALDRADPMKTKTNARTVVGAIAKGLPGSKGKLIVAKEGETLPYIYLLLHLKVIESSSLEDIKTELSLIHTLYEIDVFGSERWGAWDLETWLTDRDIKPEFWQPTFDRQHAMFTELYLALRDGRLKAPPLAIKGSKGDQDILREEAENFDYDPDAKWYGSPEKKRKEGVQDDSIYVIGGCLYTGRSLSPLDFRERKGKIDFGSFFPAQGLRGNYK
ncbi:MAG: hypothetical protein C4576_11395 [Desulfobacteraceae bacterium]|nr:MAG: hypothetical protein C4576_11395 [Desulfobacteraceae bacterium]